MAPPTTYHPKQLISAQTISIIIIMIDTSTSITTFPSFGYYILLSALFPLYILHLLYRYVIHPYIITIKYIALVSSFVKLPKNTRLHNHTTLAFLLLLGVVVIIPKVRLCYLIVIITVVAVGCLFSARC